MARVYNFSAGPAALPEDVLTQAQAEMLDWQGSGMSVMEMSHRGKRASGGSEITQCGERTTERSRWIRKLLGNRLISTERDGYFQRQ